MKTSIRLHGETYFGVDITADGRLIVAERINGAPARISEFPAGHPGVHALRQHIEHEKAHPHVCIKACGAAAFALASALVPVPGIGVTLVAPKTIPAATAEGTQQAVHLARLAERLS